MDRFEKRYETTLIRTAVATVGFTGFSWFFKQLGIDDGIVITPENIVKATLPALCTVILIEITTKEEKKSIL